MSVELPFSRMPTDWIVVPSILTVASMKSLIPGSDSRDHPRVVRGVVAELDLVHKAVSEERDCAIDVDLLRVGRRGHAGALAGRDRGETRVTEERDEADDPHDEREDQTSVTAPAK